MNTIAKTHRPIPRRRRESALSTLWEITIGALSLTGMAALIMVAVDRGADVGSGPPSAQAALPVAEDRADPFDGLPNDPEAVEKAKREAEARFAEMWKPKTLPRTNSVEALTAVDHAPSHRDRAARIVSKLLDDDHHKGRRH